jgi:hypothetical protein
MSPPDSLPPGAHAPGSPLGPNTPGRAWVRLAVGVWLLVLLAVCVRSAVQPRKRSLYPTWSGVGADWLAGRDSYRKQLLPGQEGYRYCPPVTAMLVPLYWSPERIGNVLWRLLNAGVLLGGLAWWLRRAAPERLGAREQAVLFLLVAPLALSSLNNAQVNPLLTGLLLAALAASAAERWNVAAGCLALACALKLYPLALALLLVAVRPRRLGVRLAVALALVAALPFCTQRPEYVAREYGLWFEAIRHGDLARRFGPEHLAYRDLWLLLRVWGAPLPVKVYLAVQLVTALGCLALCLAARRRGWPQRRVLEVVLVLGCCWMVLCGPATESATYILIGPALGWRLLCAHREGAPLAERQVTDFAYGLLLLCVLAGVSPAVARFQNLALQPLAVLLFNAGYLGVTLRALAERGAAGAGDAAEAPAVAVRAA